MAAGEDPASLHWGLGDLNTFKHSGDLGDIVFGDADGVVIVPLAHAEEVLERAHRKVTGENHTRAELEQGTLLGEVYRKYGIL